MFTGLIEKLGTVAGVDEMVHGRRLTIRETAIAAELQIGESVAVNGACLTVVGIDDDTFTFEVGPETLLKTNLGALQPAERVNLERALRVGDRLGGHWVQGHVDGIGRITSRDRGGEWETVWFECPPELARYLVPKGSIAVDGISLTVVDVEPCRFSVMLVPHTLQHTTLGFRPVGGRVNLETDILAKHVFRAVEACLATQFNGNRRDRFCVSLDGSEACSSNDPDLSGG